MPFVLDFYFVVYSFHFACGDSMFEVVQGEFWERNSGDGNFGDSIFNIVAGIEVRC